MRSSNRRAQPALLGALAAVGLVCVGYVGLLGRAKLGGPGSDLPAAQVALLEALGKEALRTNDVPVAAILVYEGRVIGRGFNTVKGKRDAGGHAEINAISDALASLGAEGFEALDRERLELVKTFEPCPMCQGALAMWDIRKVSFLRAKSVGRQLELEGKRVRYLWTRAQREPVDLQKALFRLHPSYPGATSSASIGGAP